MNENDHLNAQPTNQEGGGQEPFAQSPTQGDAAPDGGTAWQQTPAPAPAPPAWQAGYGGYDAQQPPPPSKAKKGGGTGGKIVAAALVAAVLGGMVGGAGGVAIGYNLAPERTAQVAAVPTEQPVPPVVSAAPVQQGGGSALSNAGSGMSYAQIAAKMKPSVVAIDTSGTMLASAYFGQMEVPMQGSGSGVILSAEGIIVTNEHVISGADSIKVILSDGTEHEAKVIGRDQRTDIALLKIDAQGLVPAQMGDSNQIQVGDVIVAIGNPLGKFAGTVTSGIISAQTREVTFADDAGNNEITMNVMQVSAAVNKGNSGGALVNDRGELIGIVNGKASASGVEGIGFAIPISDVQDIINQINDQGFVSRPALGISIKMVTEEISRKMRLSVGVYVLEVQNFSAAERAGMRVGDVIVEFDGQAIVTTQDLLEKIAAHEVGDEVTAVVVREGRNVALDITIGQEMQ